MLSYDTIHIELPRHYAPVLQNNTMIVDEETGEVVSSVGYVSNIKVRKFHNVIRIEFSLPKLLKGNNIYQLTFEEVIQALELAEKLLGVPLREVGIVRRIDFFKNIITKYKPVAYYMLLGSCKYYTRSKVKTSLYYKNSVRQQLLYDKIKEMRAKGIEIPMEFIGLNVLRYECKYLNGYLKKLFGKPLTIEQLYKKETYDYFSNRLRQEYAAIFKQPKLIADMTCIASKKELYNQLVIIGINQLGGTNEVIDLIDRSREFNPDVLPEYFSRRKKEIRDLAKNNITAFKEATIQELDEKILGI